MYTFDLMKSELLINLAKVAAEKLDWQSVTTSSRKQEVHCSALEEAKKILLQAKPTEEKGN